VTQKVLAETHVVARSSDPDFNVLKEQLIENFEEFSNKGDYGFIVKIFHRTFNANHSEEMHKLNLVGEGFLPIRNVLREDGTIYFNDFLEIQATASSFGLTQTARPMLKIKLTGNLSSPVESRERKVELKESYHRDYKPYEDIDNDDVPELDNEVIKNFQKTLAEVNQDTRQILGSAEKAKRQIWMEDNEIQERDEEDIEDRLQSQSKAIKDIANITANLDNLLGVTSFRDQDQPREYNFGDESSPVKEERAEKEDVEEEENQRLTGTFAGGITKTNPFARNLDENVESPYKEKVGLISPDIKAEIPEEFKESQRDFYEPETKEDELKDWKGTESEDKQEINAGNKENSSDNAGLSRPSEEVGKKEVSSGTSGSVSKPPLDDSSSTSTLKRLEQKFPKSMRNSGEIARIARIMGTTGGQNKKTFYNSDSD